MGGTIAKMIASKWDVVVIDLTDGEPTPFGSKAIRKKESHAASEVLGLRQRMCLNMPNRRLTTHLKERRRLAEVIREYAPNVLFGPIDGDYHPDHAAAHGLVDASRFEAKLHKTKMRGSPHWVPRQYCYYSPNKIRHVQPTFIIDVTETWATKIKAIRAYQSQLYLRNPDHTPKFIDYVTVLCRFYGQCIGTQYGEPFASTEIMGVKELNVLLG